jgi:hypothetical protein
MRWVTDRAGEQYLIPEDLEQFVRAVAFIAASRSSVGIYIASDSARHINLLAAALVQFNWNWHIYRSPISSHTSDGSTYDALFDSLTISRCDDFIATAGSTFSHFAAALGAHVPVVVGGSVCVAPRDSSCTLLRMSIRITLTCLCSYSHGRSREYMYAVLIFVLLGFVTHLDTVRPTTIFCGVLVLPVLKGRTCQCHGIVCFNLFLVLN